MKSHRFQESRSKERGSTLLLAAFALVILLGMGALAIDVATLYVARTEAQRAADAAALAGAKVFVDSGCTNSTNSDKCYQFRPQARTQAKTVGDANEVFGQFANIADTDVAFSTPSSANLRDPLIQVTIRRAVPTFLAGALQRFLGNAGSSSNVVAKATAEAFNPSGSAAQFSTACLKPWLFPNKTSDGNPILAPNGTIADPSLIGNEYTWLSGNGTKNFRKIRLVTGESVTQYQPNIENCNPAQHQFGDPVDLLPDNTPKTQEGLNNLINAPGPDSISGPPFLITPGSSNPLVQAGIITTSNRVTTSSSIVSVPLYDSSSCSGSPCPILGFMQLFIRGYVKGDDEGTPPGIDAVLLNVAGSSSAGIGPMVGGGASLLPVRLIQNP